MKYYYAPMSTAAAVTNVIHELGIADKFEWHKLYLHDPDPSKRETQSAEFKKINPNGKVPTLVLDDGTVLFESAAINIYIGKTFGVSKKFFPKAGTSEEAEAINWIIWGAVTLVKDLQQLAPGNDSSDQQKKVANENVKKNLMILNDALARNDGKSLLKGFDLTVADIHIHAWLNWFCMVAKYDISSYDKVAPWYEKICKLQGVIKTAAEKPKVLG